MLGLRRLYLLNLGVLLRRRQALAGDVQVGMQCAAVFCKAGGALLKSCEILYLARPVAMQSATDLIQHLKNLQHPHSRAAGMCDKVSAGVHCVIWLQGSLYGYSGLEMDNLQTLVSSTNELADTLRAVRLLAA